MTSIQDPLAAPPPGRVRRVWGGRDGDALVGAAILVLVILVLVAVLGPWLLPDATQTLSLSDRLVPPFWYGEGSTAHLLGTDPLGRDELGLLVVGARVSLTTGLAVVLVAGTIGTILGMVAGYRRGWVEVVVMRVVDSVVAFPGLLLALIVLALLGPSQTTVVIVLTALGWMVFTRTAHDRVLALRETPYIKAAETMGAHWTRISRRHLLPNLLPSILTVALLEFARVVLAEASLSYLGLGIQPPAASWGLMVAEGQRYISTAWWLITLPGIAIGLTVMSVNIVGNWLRTSTTDNVGQEHTIHDTGRDPATLPKAEPVPPDALLEVHGLTIDLPSKDGVVHAVRSIDFHVSKGETLAIVGESGSGKTMTALAIMGLLPSSARQSGTLKWQGEALDSGRQRALRGRQITMVFQDPVASLNPLVSVGRQIEEVLSRHGGLTGRTTRTRAIELLDLVGIPAPENRLRQFPWEMSGGMCQRVMLAIALASEPEMLIADEPTTGLDVTIQAQILELLTRIQDEMHLAVLLITHDLGIVAGRCDRVLVMHDGSIVERGDVRQVFLAPQDTYTAELIAATPRLDRARDTR